jgi:hypothetical protein
VLGLSKKWMFVIALLATSAATFAADEEKGEGKKEIKSKSKDYLSASTIDYRAALNLSFESLTSLGARIEQARDAGDPVGLAAAANELAAAENASSKKGAITAEQLTKEAIELAKLRDNSAELTAVAFLAGDSGKSLPDLAKKAKKREAEEAAAFKAGEESKGIYNELVVENHAEVPVRIWVNGRFFGFVQAFGHAHFRVHEHHHVDLDARGPHGHSWHEHVDGDYGTYFWNLYD